MVKAKFASLTAGLLARKGEAHPAANSFAVIAGFGTRGTSKSAPGTTGEPRSEPTLQDELDWMTTMAPPRDIGAPMDAAAAERARFVARIETAAARAARADSPRSAASERSSAPLRKSEGAVPLHRAGLVFRPGRVAPVPVPALHDATPPAETAAPTAQALPQRRISVTVRLDEARYLRLKLAGLSHHKTSQELLTRAIDAYLTALGVDPVTEAQLLTLHAVLKPPGDKR